MFLPEQYQLLDFGNGHKLERFAHALLDRPAPAAEGVARNDAESWRRANAVYRRVSKTEGDWEIYPPLEQPWSVAHDQLRFELRLTPFGHVGLFPEQAENWDWIARQVRGSSTPKVLNLFAYTGGSTLSAAAAGAEVVHVDAARNVVAWARRNADFSKMSNAPIRWLVEDAREFVQREVRRGEVYDAVILDPPTYGHGPKGQAWKLEKDLPALLKGCAELTRHDPSFILLTCHTPGFDRMTLRSALAKAFFREQRHDLVADPLTIQSSDGRILSTGVVARWPA